MHGTRCTRTRHTWNPAPKNPASMGFCIQIHFFKGFSQKVLINFLYSCLLSYERVELMRAPGDGRINLIYFLTNEPRKDYISYNQSCHTRMVLSRLPEYNLLLCTIRQFTRPVCPCNAVMHSFVSRFHTRMV